VLLIYGIGFNIYGSGFNLLSFWGLTLTYLYFQIPLMILILAPALDGLKKEWREASAILGREPLAVLALRRPAGAVAERSSARRMLLFANAFGAIATAYALTGSSLNIVPILFYAQIRGDVLHDPHLGYALALGMILITGARQRHLHLAPRPQRTVAAMKTLAVGPWLAFASARSISSSR
jgi:putative spermidine/putrescine transport system permease protein